MTLVGPSSSRPQWCPISLSSSIWAALPISSDDYCQMIIVSRSCQYLSAAVAANIVSRSCRYRHFSWMRLWKSLAILSDSSRISAELCSISADSCWNSTNTWWVFNYLLWILQARHRTMFDPWKCENGVTLIRLQKQFEHSGLGCLTTRFFSY